MNVKNLTTIVTAAAGLVALGMSPAHAGSWQLTGSTSGTDLSGTYGTGILVLGSSGTSYSMEDVFDNGGSESGTFTFSGTIQWVGGGTPSKTVTLTESATARGTAGYTSTAKQTASDGFADPAVTSPSNMTYPAPSVTTVSTGTHTTTVTIPAGSEYKFTRTFSASSSGGEIDDCFVGYSITIN